VKRIITRSHVIQRAARIAFGPANDCVRLALLPQEQQDPGLLDSLDLSLLSEFKRNANGSVEIRLASRLDALRLLAELVGDQDSSPQALELIRALNSAAAPS